MGESLTVLVPSSPEDAVRLFGDGAGVTVVGGGTIVVPSLALGRRSAERALLLHRAGLAGVRRDGGRVTIGATTTLDALGDVPDPLRTAVAHVADHEIRGQATIGGNICAEVSDAPRGDLQGALIALGAQVRSTGAGGERTEAIEDFLPGRQDRLVLDVVVRRAGGRGVRVPRPAAHPRLHRPRRVGGAGDGRHRSARRHRHRPARAAALTPDDTDGLPFADDAPRLRLVSPAHAAGTGAPGPDEARRLRMKMTVNGVAREVVVRAPDAAPARAARRARHHEPEGRLPGRRLRRLHRDRRRRGAPELPAADRRPRGLRGPDGRRASARRSSWHRSSRPGCTTTRPSAASAPAA